MQRWQTFLNSIATPGGNLLMLAAFVAILLAIVIHALHGDKADSDQVTTVVLATFSGFSGALLQALRGRTTDIPAPPGSTSTTTTATKTTEAPKENLDAPKV